MYLSPRQYYRNDLKLLYKKLVPKGKKLLLLKDVGQIKTKEKFDYIVLDNLIGNSPDIQKLFLRLKTNTHHKTRVIVTYYNHLWEPVLKIATRIGLRKKVSFQNWLDNNDIKNLLNLSGYETITSQKRFLLPLYIPILSDLVNKWIAQLPLINSLCLTSFVIARPKTNWQKEYSVSIIVPARNEQENIPKITKSIPAFGNHQEIIFVEGNSNDNTWEEIQKELDKKHRKNLDIRAFRQKGHGKWDAVKLGFNKAKNNILIIYDADRTVSGKDISKFYAALSSGVGEFANGSRLIYPMETEAMRILNKFGNKSFSIIFTWLLGQHFKDTLCGTKAIFKTDYEDIKKLRNSFFKRDPFGDFYLIFGAALLNLKVVEIPVRYLERRYGSTNISRFSHGLLLLKMTWLAFRKIKAW